MIDDEVVNMLKGQQTEEQRYVIHLESKLSWQYKRLIKAKDIIQGLLSCCRNYPQENIEKIQQAKQFLKEVDE